MSALTLYEIEGEVRHLLELLEDESGELTTDLEKLLDEWDNKLQVKAQNYCQLIFHLEALHVARHAEADRLYELARLDQARADRLRNRIKGAMDRLGLKRIDTELFKLNIQTNGGKPTTWWDGPPDEIPQALRKVVPPVLDITAALALPAEERPSGLIVERGTHLRIK